MSKINTRIYYVTVFLTGAAVLIFEVTAIRMLSPYFGSSLYVLSSVLTVVLAALSLGYYFGGRIADKYTHYVPLYLIITTAGVVMLFLLVVSQFLLPISPQLFSIISGPLVMGMGLFFIPALLLGADSPYVIKLLTNNLSQEHSGAVVGSTFFWSTIGSIVGSLSAGFYLIPNLGLNNTIVSVSVFLVIWGILSILILNKFGDKNYPPSPIKALSLKLLIMIVTTLFLSYQALNVSLFNSNVKLLYKTDGYYSKLQVIEVNLHGNDYRFLKQDNNFSSASIPNENTIVLGYTQLAVLYKEINPEAKNFLVLGAGAYSIPRHIHRLNPEINISVFEIEEKLKSVAVEYFELPETDKIKNVVGDARILLRDSPEKYDVIFSDVMNSGFYIPPHLSSQEFFMEMKKKLSPEGVIFVNFIGVIPFKPMSLTGSMIKTITSIFPNYEIVALDSAKSTKLRNIVFILRHDNQKINLPDVVIDDMINSNKKQISELIVDKNSFDLENQVIFTDNLSKVEPFVFKQFAESNW